MGHRHHFTSRRVFLQAALAAGTTPLWPAVFAQSTSAPSTNGTQLILLGTKGGPTPSEFRAAPANVLVVDGRPYVIDCGNGVAIQLTKAGAPAWDRQRIPHAPALGPQRRPR